MARSLFVAVALLGLVALAQAAPCIECKDCKTDNCRRSCSAKCPQTVDGDKCKRMGADWGKKASADACETTKTYCNGGQKSGSRTFGGIGQVSLKQCANIAYGRCQQVAMDPSNPFGPNSDCGRSLMNGFRQCNRQEFRQFYEGEINELCYKYVSANINY